MRFMPKAASKNNPKRTGLKEIRTEIQDARAKLKDVKKRAQILWRKSLKSQDDQRQSEILSKIKKSGS